MSSCLQDARCVHKKLMHRGCAMRGCMQGCECAHSWQRYVMPAVCATTSTAPASSMHTACTTACARQHAAARQCPPCRMWCSCRVPLHRIVLHQLCARARTSSAVSIISIRLSTPQPPSGSISFSLAKIGRAREPAATLPRASVDGAEKAREEEARDSMPMVSGSGSVGI